MVQHMCLKISIRKPKNDFIQKQITPIFTLIWWIFDNTLQFCQALSKFIQAFYTRTVTFLFKKKNIETFHDPKFYRF